MRKFTTKGQGRAELRRKGARDWEQRGSTEEAIRNQKLRDQAMGIGQKHPKDP